MNKYQVKLQDVATTHSAKITTSWLEGCEGKLIQKLPKEWIESGVRASRATTLQVVITIKKFNSNRLTLQVNTPEPETSEDFDLG